jgi:hypothetical protein
MKGGDVLTSMHYPLIATMEDDSQIKVIADQRDVARWEIQPFGTSLEAARGRSFTFLRFLCWNAARRTGATKLTWEQFDDRCVDVDVEEGFVLPDDVEDPGSPVVPAVTS